MGQSREWLISDYMREQNSMLHRAPDGYGGGGWKRAEIVDRYAGELRAWTVLDYGCGEGTLKRELVQSFYWSPDRIFEYDPAVPKRSRARKADLVVCTDVLEHVEPERLGNVLRHIRSRARRGVFFAIAMRPSNKTLPDGQNTHLIIQNWGWWLDRLVEAGYGIACLRDKHGEDGAPYEVLIWARPCPKV